MFKYFYNSNWRQKKKKLNIKCDDRKVFLLLIRSLLFEL